MFNFFVGSFILEFINQKAVLDACIKFFRLGLTDIILIVKGHMIEDGQYLNWPPEAYR